MTPEKYVLDVLELDIMILYMQNNGTFRPGWCFVNIWYITHLPYTFSSMMWYMSTMTLYWVYINVNVAFNGWKWKKIGTLGVLCTGYWPQISLHIQFCCIYRYRRVISKSNNPLVALVKYMIKQQMHIQKFTDLPSRQVCVCLWCCVLRLHTGILLSLYNVRNTCVLCPGWW